MVLMKAPIQRYQKQQAFEKKQKKLVMTKKNLNIEIQINVFAAMLSCCITCNLAYYGYVFYGRSVL